MRSSGTCRPAARFYYPRTPVPAVERFVKENHDALAGQGPL